MKINKSNILIYNLLLSILYINFLKIRFIKNLLYLNIKYSLFTNKPKILFNRYIKNHSIKTIRIKDIIITLVLNQGQENYSNYQNIIKMINITASK